MKRILIFLFIVSFIFVGIGPTDSSATEKEEISILFTHDIHDHIQGKTVTRDGKTEEIGGFGRLMTGINQAKSKYPNSFLFDGGDFSMGTPYQTIYEIEAPELVMMGKLGYDAVTLGNHEFDYRAEGLANMLNRASQVESTSAKTETVLNEETWLYETITTPATTMPALVGTNIQWEKTLADETLGETGMALYNAFNAYGVNDYTILEKDGVKIAVFGVMGEEAISDAPVSGVLWEDTVAWTKNIVAEIKRNEEADMIVCLSHSGINNPEKKEGEDVTLAKEVPDIDLIISGHSHTLLEEPIVEGNTTIVSCGNYTEYLGQMVMEKDGDRYKYKEYNLLELDSNVAVDPAIQAEADGYLSKIDESYFSRFSLAYAQTLTTAGFTLPGVEEVMAKKDDNALGNIIADSYRYAANQALSEEGKTVDIALVPSGSIRDTFNEGSISTADAFNVSSLGIGPDRVPGYPLVGIYLTGKEIKSVIEVDTSISDDMPTAHLFMSGVKYSFNDHRMFFNKAFDISLVNSKGEEVKLEDDQLYYVVSGLYSAQMLSAVKDKSKGLLSIVPKDAEGNEITDFEEQIIYDNGVELKEWYALASYLQSFGGEGIPEIYSSADGRKLNRTSWNPVTLLKQPNRFLIIVTALILIPIVIIVGLIVGLRRRKYKRRGYRSSIFAGRSNYGRSGKPQFKQRKIRMKRRRF